MQDIIKSPYDGEPATVQGVDEAGNPVIAVHARHLTPWKAQVADLEAFMVSCGMVAFGLTGVFGLDNPELGQRVLGAVFVVAAFALNGWFRRTYREDAKAVTEVRFTDKTFAIRRKRNQWEVFDRQLPHSFALLPHDRTQQERDEHDYEKQKASIGRYAVKPIRYYSDSFVVVFEHLGQRNDILEVQGQKEAHAILARFQFCDAVMDAARQSGKSGLGAADQWAGQTGDIPEFG
jgi:hypothetical protein